jgi:hypothetical protein
MPDFDSLTTTQIVSAVTQTLVDGDYESVDVPKSWSGLCRLFEDDYGIVAVYLYDTFDQLTNNWVVAQGQLVDLMSEKLSSSEAKAWEGYLVLLTTATVPLRDQVAVSELRSNTSRVRKLVAAGEELQTIEDVRRVLLPLLPLDIPSTISQSSRGLINRVPELLERQNIDRALVEVVVEAFLRNDLIVQRIHEFRTRR